MTVVACTMGFIWSCFFLLPMVKYKLHSFAYDKKRLFGAVDLPLGEAPKETRIVVEGLCMEVIFRKPLILNLFILLLWILRDILQGHDLLGSWFERRQKMGFGRNFMLEFI